MPIEELPVIRSWMKLRGWRGDIWNFLNNIETHIQTHHAELLAAIASISSTRLIVYTVKMVNADEQYRQRLPEHTKGFTIQVTDGTAFRLSTEPNRVAAARRPYWSVPMNSSYDEADLDLHGVTLYFASSTADKTIEIFVKV